MNWTGWLDAASTGHHEVEIALRFLLAGLCGAMIGFERESPDRAAGLRTHTLVAVAAAMFTILTFEIHSQRGAGDPVRIISSVTAGVAFLAAGSIIQSGGRVRGVTTGAAMWMAGALGLACGAGFYVVAGIGTAITLLILRAMRSFEGWLTQREHSKTSAQSKSHSGTDVRSSGNDSD